MESECKVGGGTTPITNKKCRYVRNIGSGRSIESINIPNNIYVDSPMAAAGVDGPTDGNRLCSSESSYTAQLDTPYGVDVARCKGDTDGGLSTPGVSPRCEQSNVMESIDCMSRIVGIHDIISLVKPKHNWFKDKIAEVIEYVAYRNDEQNNYLMYPKIGGLNGERVPYYNPYRLHKLSRTNTARRVRMVMDLIEQYALKGFKIEFLTLTMPEQLSKWLSEQVHGREYAWRIYGKMWSWYNKRFGPGLAAVVNLHTWKTQKPLEPHYHFHCLIPNYRLVESDIVDNDENETYEFEKMKWHKQRGGRDVPLSDNELTEVKEKWFTVLDQFVKKHGIEWPRMKSAALGSKSIDLYIAYSDIESEYGRTRLIHWFNYQGRSPLEDYAKYSNENIDCPGPPEWLSGYTNNARRFGWWRNMGTIVKKKKKPHSKIHPVSGKEMDYQGSYTIYQILNSGPVGFLDIVRGVPVFHRLSIAEVNALISIQRKKPDVPLKPGDLAYMWKYYGTMLTGRVIIDNAGTKEKAEVIE